MDIRKWLIQKKHVELSHLQISNFERTGRGVKSTKDILENEQIISIPSDLLITKDYCTKNIEELKECG